MIKKSEFDSDFESVNKLQKRLTNKKIIGQKRLHTVIKSQNSIFLLISFFASIFFNFFSRLEISINLSVF